MFDKIIDKGVVILNIKHLLENLTVVDLGDLCSKAEVNSKGRKQELIDKLLDFYNKPNWAKEVYDKLKPLNKN